MPSGYQIRDATVWEKLDGTLINIWYNPFETVWQASTRKMAYAEGNVPGVQESYRSVVNRALGAPDLTRIMGNLDRNKTHIFELTSPETRVVTRYPDTAMRLLGIRSNSTGEEVTHPAVLKCIASIHLKLKVPDYTSAPAICDVATRAASLPTLQEGYVVTWPDGYRIKVKNPGYVELAKSHNNGVITTRRVLRLLLDGEAAEYLAYFPEDNSKFEGVEGAIQRLELAVCSEYSNLSHLPTQKDFALEAKDSKYAKLLFGLRKANDYNATFGNLTFNVQEQLVSLHL